MFRCLGKNLQQINVKDAPTITTTHGYFWQNPYFKSISHTSFFCSVSSGVQGVPAISHISNATNRSSFTVDYLINSCGLSTEATLSAAKRIQLKTTENPDSVLAFFKNHGFTNAHISIFIAKCPSLLLSNPDKTLKPKIDFFNDSGISGTNLAKILSSNPSLLQRSLEHQITPAFNFLKSFAHTKEHIVDALRRSTQVLECNIQKKILPNISILRNHGVPESRITKLIITNPRVLALRSGQFNEVVLKVKEMGFDPINSTFVMAVRAMSVMSKSTWEGKMEVYRNLGWADDEILLAFKKQPCCMMASENKIRKISYFFANELDWEPSVLSKFPYILLLSLEKRIAPRCSVLKILMSKGLVKNDSSIYWVFKLGEKEFLEKFVIKYQEEIPEVSKAYQGKMGLTSDHVDEINNL